MAEPASERGLVETLALAGVGAFALAAGRADDLADELATRLGVERDEVRGALSDTLDVWRREARRAGEQSGELARRLAEELGVASREVVDDLQLRVAQLEHRLKLLERSS